MKNRLHPIGRPGTANQYPCLRRPRRGAAAVEFALVAPVMILVLLGIIEFGRAFMVMQLMTNAAREGARVAVVQGSTNTEVQTKVEDYLQSGGISSQDATITIAVNNAQAANDVSKAKSADECSITVEIPYNNVKYVVGKFLGNKTLQTQVTMRHE